ncbi:MAG: GAF domain-containing protein [Acidobacteria bacterium]|nr:GAF domain-containing protein [Acidobacteriota bacterium]
MPARLTVYLADRPARVLTLSEEAELVVGRDPAGGVFVDDSRVSRRHARLRRGAEGWEISDLGSKNGILVDGVPASPRLPLAARSWLSLGGVLASFEVLSEGQHHQDTDAQTERRRSTLAARRRLAAAGSLDAVVLGLLDSAIQLARAERGFVLLARPDGELAVAAARGLADGELGGTEFSGSIGAVARALETRRVVVTADALADPALGGRASVVRGGIRALACVPLAPLQAVTPLAPIALSAGGPALDRCLGALYADSRSPGSAFTELDVEILEALASQAALAIATAHLDEEMARLLADVEAVSGRAPLLWSELLAAHGTAGGTARQEGPGG